MIELWPCTCKTNIKNKTTKRSTCQIATRNMKKNKKPYYTMHKHKNKDLKKTLWQYFNNAEKVEIHQRWWWLFNVDGKKNKTKQNKEQLATQKENRARRGKRGEGRKGRSIIKPKKEVGEEEAQEKEKRKKRRKMGKRRRRWKPLQMFLKSNLNISTLC
jgi:hypothetical protein